MERSFIADLSWRGRRTLGLVHLTTGDIKWTFVVRQAAAARAKKPIVLTQATQTHFEAHAPGWKHRRAREIWLKPDRPLPLSDRRAARRQ